MNEEIFYISNKEKTDKNEWKYDDSDFFPALIIVYKSLVQFFLHTLLANLFKQRYISCITSYIYLNKLIREV